MSCQVVLGRSGLEVSPICFGTWQLAERFWGNVDSADVSTAIRKAYDAGVNFFDTAGAYGEGRAESVLGEALTGLPRESIVIATKVFHHFYPDGRRHGDLSAGYVAGYCDEALARLGTDYIDLYQLHSFDPYTPLEETTAALDKLRQTGKIRCYGVSNFSVEQIRLARRYGDYATCQPHYNLLDTRIEGDLLPYCASENIGVLVYSSLALGMLTGKFDGSETFHDLRAHTPRFSGERFKKLAAKVRGLQPLADKYGLTITQLCLAATLAHSAIHCAIVGIKSAEQIVEAAGAMGKTIDREDYFAICGRLRD